MTIFASIYIWLSTITFIAGAVIWNKTDGLNFFVKLFLIVLSLFGVYLIFNICQ